MEKRFVESPSFLDWVKSQPIDWDVRYAALQTALMSNPNLGVVIRGCGGLRKLRIADMRRGKGKRGGARIIYLHVPEANWIYMIDVFDKNEKDDWSEKERKAMTAVAEAYRKIAMESIYSSDEE